jgi:hypothetical protein
MNDVDDRKEEVEAKKEDRPYDQRECRRICSELAHISSLRSRAVENRATQKLK